MANEEPGWKRELTQDLGKLERSYRSYERTPSQEVREDYERDLSRLWHQYAERLDIQSEAEREMLASTYQRATEREGEQNPNDSNFQIELSRLTELQDQRDKELQRMCTDPLVEYDRQHGFTRDQNTSERER